MKVRNQDLLSTKNQQINRNMSRLDQQLSILNKQQLAFQGRTPAYMRPSLIRPPRAMHKLEYKSDLTTLSAGATFLVKSFVANGLYDPDPAILSTSYAGFAWLSLAYYENLVQKSTVKWNVINNVDTPVTVAITFGFEQLDSTLSTWQQVRDAAENDFSTKPITLARPGEGGVERTIRASCALQDLLKKGVYQMSELYSGGNASNPTTLIYVNFLVWSTDGTTNLTAGITNDITLTATAEFYGPRRLIDTATQTLVNSSIVEDESDYYRLRFGSTLMKYPKILKENIRQDTNLLQKQI